MRIAAIDIGTNSLHTIVVRVRADLSFEVIDRKKEMVRLGAGGLGGRALTPESVHAALQALSKFARLAQSHRVDEIVAVATSATREAENRRQVPQYYRKKTGIRPKDISGKHANHVARLALMLFDETRAVHGRTDREREWLETPSRTLSVSDQEWRLAGFRAR